jgi:hypothetical protein
MKINHPVELNDLKHFLDEIKMLDFIEVEKLTDTASNVCPYPPICTCQHQFRPWTGNRCLFGVERFSEGIPFWQPL